MDHQQADVIPVRPLVAIGRGDISGLDEVAFGIN